LSSTRGGITIERPEKVEKLYVVFGFDRDTSRTRRFTELGSNLPNDVIGIQYIQKSALRRLDPRGTLPENVTITIEAGVSEEAKEHLRP